MSILYLIFLLYIRIKYPFYAFSQHLQQVVKDLRNYKPVKTYTRTGFVLQNLKN